MENEQKYVIKIKICLTRVSMKTRRNMCAINHYENFMWMKRANNSFKEITHVRKNEEKWVKVHLNLISKR